MKRVVKMTSLSVEWFDSGKVLTTLLDRVGGLDA